MKLIENLAEEIISNQSFAHTSFADAETTIHFELDGEKKFYRYDCLSLWNYEHNLTAQMYSSLGKLLSEKWEKRANSEEKKARIEYGTLLLYSEMHSVLKNANIQKCEHPDFCLTLDDGRRIGIEVTEFIRADEKITSAIAKKYASCTLSVDEIKKRLSGNTDKRQKDIPLGYLTIKLCFAVHLYPQFQLKRL